MMLFDDIADFERALALGVLQEGDCVQVARAQLRALPPRTYEALARRLLEAGARLVEGEPPGAVAVYRGNERRPTGCGRATDVEGPARSAR